VGAKQAVSGDRRQTYDSECGNCTVQGYVCSYTDTGEDVVCLFPFTGSNPGQKSGGSSYFSCLSTKRGHTWCSVKVTQSGRLAATSTQNRDITCGQQRSPQGTLLCPHSPTDKPSTPRSSTTTKPKPKSTVRTQTRTTSSPSSIRPTVRQQITQSQTCSGNGKVSDGDLKQFSEDLLRSDSNNARDKVRLDTGCKTRVGRPQDCSPGHLITLTDKQILNRPTYAKVKELYENYLPDVTKKEDRNKNEKQEENTLLDEMMKTQVMKNALTFLQMKNVFCKSVFEFKNLLRELWFSVYSRGKRIDGSSGFEHVFLGEKKNGKVQGFHNWLYFLHLEDKNEVNYLGHWKAVDLGGKATGMSFTFTWGDQQKPFGSMLVGPSPEFEMALYTVCLLSRGDQGCTMSLGGREVVVTTHLFTRRGGVKYVASAFMDW